MHRRRFLAALGTAGLAGCSTLSSTHTATPNLHDPVEPWGQYRGGPGKPGITDHAYPTVGPATVRRGPESDPRATAPPVVAQGRLLVPTPETIAILDLADLATVTTIETDRHTNLPPVCGSGVVAIQTSDRILAYSLETGGRHWQLPADPSYVLGNAPAAFERHFLFADGGRLRLVAQASGEIVWRRDLDRYGHGFAATPRTIAVVQNAGETSTLAGLDTRSGEDRWRVDVESTTLHPVVDGTVYALSEFGRLYAVREGVVQWTLETDLTDPEALALHDGVLVAGPAANDEYVGVDRSDGTVRWRTTLELGGRPLLSDGTLFVSTANQGIRRRSLVSGAELRTYEDPRFARHLVPYADGLVYVRAPDDRVRALVLDDAT